MLRAVVHVHELAREHVVVPEVLAALGRAGARVRAVHGRDDWRQSIYYHDYEPRGKHHVPLHDALRTDRFKLIHY